MRTVYKPSQAQNKVLKELDKLKDRSGSNFDSIHKQYDEMVYNLETEGVHFMAQIPPFENKKTGLFNNRNKVLGVPKMRFSSSSDVLVPKKFENFLLADYNNVENDGKRILIFCRKEVRSMVKSFSHILCDGTFKSSPKAFKQLYSIHAYNEKSKSVTPIFFCLLPDKSQQTYEILFRLIRSIFPDWKPLKVTMDFEKAAMKAVAKVYNGIEIKGCYFHYNRCLIRKAKQLKISTPVKQRHVSRCAGIARLPPELTASVKYVMRKSPAGTDIKKFNTQWLEKINFNKTCCCSKEEIRTTNNLEGWHSRINRFLGKNNTTLAILLDILIKETNITNIFKTSSKKAKIYVQIDAEINSAVSDIKNGLNTVGHCASCVELISPYVFKF